MRHLLLTLQYCGTRYHGFQVQKNARSVAETVQDAVERVFEGRLDIKGCSRTDAGVHANRFALTLRTSRTIPCDAVVRAMNVSLPPDIAVLACREVASDFHPRYSCLGKRYLYRIWNAPHKNAFLEGLALHYPYPLDEARMDTLARVFEGTHDFRGFCSAGGSVTDTVRSISHARVWREQETVLFSVTGDGFLYNMVRILVGTLLLFEREERSPEELAELLASGDRSRAGATAPPQGLFLDAVFYSDFALLPAQSCGTLAALSSGFSCRGKTDDFTEGDLI